MPPEIWPVAPPGAGRRRPRRAARARPRCPPCSRRAASACGRPARGRPPAGLLDGLARERDGRLRVGVDVVLGGEPHQAPRASRRGRRARGSARARRWRARSRRARTEGTGARWRAARGRGRARRRAWSAAARQDLLEPLPALLLGVREPPVRVQRAGELDGGRRAERSGQRGAEVVALAVDGLEDRGAVAAQPQLAAGALGEREVVLGVAGADSASGASRSAAYWRTGSSRCRRPRATITRLLSTSASITCSGARVTASAASRSQPPANAPNAAKASRSGSSSSS